MLREFQRRLLGRMICRQAEELHGRRPAIGVVHREAADGRIVGLALPEPEQRSYGTAQQLGTSKAAPTI